VLLVANSCPILQAQQDKAKPEKVAVVPMNVVSAKEWSAASTAALTPGDLDGLINAELKKAKIKPAPLTTDEEFIRRVYLDVVGKLPTPTEITDFTKDQTPNKRAKLIDQLLGSDDYAKNWGRYWKNVITTRVTDFQTLFMSGTFERWLVGQLKKNAGWGEIVHEMLTASGAIRRDEPDKNGQAFFMLAFRGADALTERTAETSRIFMGIQLQCAQCHDHPFDNWKRNQFHELAAYFVRAKERPVFDEEKKMILGFQVMSMPFGEHRMVDKDKKLNEPMNPKFIDGTSPGKNLKDMPRREALAKAITSKDNPWFAAAFTNRMWSELLGQTFYQPVDDLGPQREAVMPKIVARLSGAFRGSNYNIKELLRVILNTEAYQRQSRMGKSTDEHQFFAANYPKRLNADALWNSLECVLGKMEGGFGGGKFGGGKFPGFGPKGQFIKEFAFDPSSRPEEIEGTLPQALLMMNNPILNQKIKVTTFSMLGQLLKKHADNGDAIRQLYLTTLCRQPTANELKTCLNHVTKAESRNAAFEDMLWVLINSTEFQTRK
jgi:hypothetical protein